MNNFFHIALNRELLKLAVKISLFIGLFISITVFFTFNYYISVKFIHISQLVLFFLVPFIVTLYILVSRNMRLKPGSISHIDALLKCTSCHKTDFHAQIGGLIEECPDCGKHTRWKPTSIFSSFRSDNDVLKSLALFARYNPQPLFRVNKDGIITSSNPASENLFDFENLVGQNIKLLITELEHLDFQQIIQNNTFDETIISFNGRFYNLVLKGVRVINTLNIYGNDITNIVMAEDKIKNQAKEINKSIQYASLIQKAILPNNTLTKKIFPNHFIFNRPRDVVSGDFYWVNEVGKYKIASVADCTGHGVPGAFMSMIGLSLLNEIVLRENVTKPDEILNQLRERLIYALSTGAEQVKITDGMDIAMVVIDSEEHTLSYSGAFNPLVIYRNAELIVKNADLMPVGRYIEELDPFTLQTMDIFPGDRFYLFSDGFQDQFGGEFGKKYSSRALRNLLVETGKLPLQEQYKILKTTFENWMGELDQIDDVLIMGVELN